MGDRPFFHFTVATFVEAVLVGVAVAVSITTLDPGAERARYLLIVLLALAMGAQNATARRLGIPNLTTTVLTLTLTGLAADFSSIRTNPQTARGLAAVGAMFLGAAAGAALISGFGVSAALGLASVLLATAGIVAYRHSSSLAPKQLTP